VTETILWLASLARGWPTDRDSRDVGASDFDRLRREVSRSVPQYEAWGTRNPGTYYYVVIIAPSLSGLLAAEYEWRNLHGSAKDYWSATR
jgi:hypothetical protein